MGYNLGVDLGTTFVAAAIARDGRPEMCTLGSQTMVSPAVVYFTEESRLAFGDAAERRALSQPDRVERAFKRRLGDPTPVVLGGVPHAVTALMAAQLRDVLDTVSRVEGEMPERVALTYPATWGPYRRELFEEVPRLAGLHDHVALTEPEAAAAFYGASRLLGEGDTLAVYDLGGGTFDATVLRKRGGAVEVVGDPDGMERLGGIDFDEAILQWIDYRNGGALSDLDLSQPGAAAAMARLRQECVHAKEALSADIETSIPVLLPHRQFVAHLTRAEFEGLIRAPVESTIGTLIRAVHTARLDVGQLSGVLLVGGSSRIPLIERMVAAETGRPTVTDAHPKYAVALGAAVVAGLRPASAMPPPLVVAPSEPVAEPTAVDAPIVLPRRRRIAAILAIVAAVLLLAGAAVHLAGRDNGQPTNAIAPSLVPSTAAPTASVPTASAVAAVAVARAPAVAVPSIGRSIALGRAPDYVAVAPDGRRLYIASGEQTVSVLDVATGTVTSEIPTPGPARFVSFSPDGRYAYVSLWDERDGEVHAVSVVDTDDNTIKKTFPVRTRPYLAAVTPDGNWLYVPNHDGHTVTVIDARRLVQVAEITVPPEPHYVSFSVDGTRAYVADHESNNISVVDTATRRVLTNIDVGHSPHAVEQNPHRPLLMNVNWDDGTVCVIDTTDDTVRRTISVGTQPLALRWSADGRYAYVVNSGSDNVSVIRADTMQVTATLPTGDAPTSIAVLPDGSRGYISNSKAKTLTVLNLTR
ncbi:YVTN family beta-propeller protein [Actinoplanes lutulentus]|uniref:YVTN family beta-propeller protein n=1 Tax=Actinoplanes lutulentus TaxID=1287878 RepID=A0A327YZM4_9ACTN|nr:Hsp70 family protein [Actinoplanes lutulentus]MBB2944647.1 YVTN family beta-propeller protein [Actinoplanes lutulentus]RAK27146.1 YVTN family beta-propeller protein [Actinoplanes lutulentus]